MFGAFSDGKESQPSTSSSSSSSIEQSQPCRHFKFPEILLATNNFDESLVIGQGGFGKVYKGTIINRSSVAITAIKRLDSMSTQGATEFWAEVEMLSKLRHCHLVSLLGYCNHGKEMILVYEYMPNGTLEDHLHKLGTPLSWIQRLKVCIGAGRGLHYLHTGTGIEVGVIHRDVKTSNILLHESWAAKISDFGLSKIGPTNQRSTYVNTLVKGTFGYLDPDYFFTGRLTRKSDVYAFGVVLFEVLCRKRAVDRSLDEEQHNLARWAQESIKEGKLKHIVDSCIKDQISSKCLKKFVQIAEKCLHNNPKQRPTMAEVVVCLEAILTLQEKTNSLLLPTRKTIFGRMVYKFPFPSNRENSAYEDSKLSSNSKEINDTIGAHTNHIPSLKVFRFLDLVGATRNFSQVLGGYGEVFLGWIDKNTFAPSTKSVGIAIAVKRYKQRRPEWQTVMTILGRMSHPNIITLLGYCDYREHKCFLVYEYLANRNLEEFLFGGVVEPLSWGTRVMILIGVAHGLAYLHLSKDQVIHGDIQTSNIFLDQDFNAKLGDFEMAKFGVKSPKFGATTTHVGALSDLSPSDYYKARIKKSLMGNNLSVNSDIYNFGVVLLETLTGQRAWDIKRPIYHASLVTWTSPFLVDKRELKKIMDPSLEQSYPLEAAFECATLALRCLALDPEDRPSIEEVLRSLQQIFVISKCVQVKDRMYDCLHWGF